MTAIEWAFQSEWVWLAVTVAAIVAQVKVVRGFMGTTKPMGVKK